MPTGRICAVVTEVPTYLMKKYDAYIGVPRAEYRGPGTAGRVRAGESREGTHAHFVFQVYISPAPKPSKWRIGPQYEKCIWNLVYIDLTIYQVYIHTHVGLVSAVPGALVTTRPCEDRAYKTVALPLNITSRATRPRTRSASRRFPSPIPPRVQLLSSHPCVFYPVLL